jgi:hypothetical protein
VTGLPPRQPLDFAATIERPDLEPIATIVRKCIHDDPMFRFVTAEALETALRAAVTDDVKRSPREADASTRAGPANGILSRESFRSLIRGPETPR